MCTADSPKTLHSMPLGTLEGDEQVDVLTNLNTGERFVMTECDDLGYSSSSDGSGWWRFRLKHLESIPAGGYSLAIEYISKGKSLSNSYKAIIAIRDAPDGKQLSIDRTANGELPVGWVD